MVLYKNSMQTNHTTPQNERNNAYQRKFHDGLKSKLDRIEAAVEILPSLVQRLDHLETLITTSVVTDRPADQREQQQKENG
jgi:hypothetical protein